VRAQRKRLEDAAEQRRGGGAQLGLGLGLLRAQGKLVSIVAGGCQVTEDA
jgi:hypothetical protein